MDCVQYLEQAYYLDQTINRKLREIESLRLLLSKTSSIITGMPRNASTDLQPVDSIVAKVIDLERDVTLDIDNLVDTKRNITFRISQIPNEQYQNLLSLRYLCARTWGQIAVDMGYDRRHILRMHDNAIDEFKKENNFF